MDGSRFDAWTRRRFGLATGGAIAAALGLMAAGSWGGVEAKKRKKPRPNEFGCLNVGQPCGGKDARCCSGICQGKKPKKGKKDTSRCAPHDTGGCTVDRTICSNAAASSCSPTSIFAACWRTTGNAGFCADEEGSSLEANCQPCSKDTDCEALGFGAGAACLVLRTEDGCLSDCEGINGSTGTACLPPFVP